MIRNKDLRIIKTQKVIRDAFIDLLDKNGFEAITVQEIANAAMINRSTFYLHYVDKYDLLQKTAEQALANIIELVAPETHIVDGELEYSSFKENIRAILKVVEDDAVLYKVLLNDPQMIDINQKFQQALIGKMDSSFPNNILISRDLFLEWMTSLYMSVIRWWLNQNMKYSSNFIAEEFIKLLVIGPVKTVGF
ncbi:MULTISPECIES: TetR/AcrR family transcriptional regulator [unclassified Paenibacillus]|uniref:TetR/AcrR family transcriptional regulator n=1 Tax=unclassified Paenibacillus TaxID=185978 RepID=UPI0004915582|nr:MULTISPECIES: TetR/AcrR family transcriptional regulator [unclassified Paenibacillus]SFR23280.1 DNA-binding transcriptional regulator, AcrR family [Paenibacillus sp. cl130]